ncbi:unnamed protein product [Clonostachys byssicola]|uniref:Uncharacterized protein n=1 Tax=Clonostachys byssicola TaxID=160290 RepID=A0A9N9USR7_9HYPO|nr:unnamed protein product [Clonostachys byssicola]
MGKCVLARGEAVGDEKDGRAEERNDGGNGPPTRQARQVSVSSAVDGCAGGAVRVLELVVVVAGDKVAATVSGFLDVIRRARGNPSTAVEENEKPGSDDGFRATRMDKWNVNWDSVAG